MSGRLIEIYHQILRRETRIPPPIPASKLSHKATTPKVGRTSIPTMAGVVQPNNCWEPKIETVDPEKLAAEAIAQPAAASPTAQTENVASSRPSMFARIKGMPSLLKSTAFKAAAAATAFVTATIIPRLASAGVIEHVVHEITNFTPFGIGILSGLVLLAIGLNRLYFNPRYKARPGDPTPKRIISKLVLPLLGVSIMAGAAIYTLGSLLPVLGIALPFSSTLVYPALILGTLGMTGLLILRSWIKEIYNRAQTVRSATFTYSKKNRFFTSFLSYHAQAADLIYMTYRAVTVTSIAVGVAGRMILGTLNPASLLWGAGFGLLYYIFYYRGKARNNNPSNNFTARPQRGLWPMAKLALLGAAGGFIMTLAGPSYLINLLFAIGVFVAEAHGFVHAWRWNTAARDVEETAPKIYSDQEIQEAAMNPDAAMVSILKAGFAGNLPEIIPALWVNIHTRQGANWEVHQINGQEPSAGTRAAFEKMYTDLALLISRNDIYRAWIRDAYDRMNAAAAAGNTAQAYEEVAALYERIARAFTVPCPDNNGVPPWHGNLGASGFVGFPNQPLFHGTNENIEHYQALGRRMYTLGGVFLQQIANELRNRSQEYQNPSPTFTTLPGVLKPSHAEVVARLKLTLDGLNRKHNVPVQMDPFMLFTNYYPQYDITKMEKLNKYNGFVRDVWTAMSLVRFSPTGQRFYTELIPTKVVKMLKTEHDASVWQESPDEPNYRQVKNVESRPNEDNRFKWVDRPLATIGETHSDIFCIDDSDHFNAHKDDLNIYPTAHNQEVPLLGPNEYRDVVFTDGTRLRMYGDGTGQHLDRHKNPIRDTAGNVIPPLASTASSVSREPAGKLFKLFRRYGDGMIEEVDAAGNTLRHIRDGVRWLGGTQEECIEILPFDGKLGMRIFGDGTRQYLDEHKKPIGPRLREHDYFDLIDHDKSRIRIFGDGAFQRISPSGQVSQIIRESLEFLSSNVEYFTIVLPDKTQLRAFDDNTVQYFDSHQIPLTPRLKPTDFYDIRVSPNITIRRHGNGSVQEIDEAFGGIISEENRFNLSKADTESVFDIKISGSKDLYLRIFDDGTRQYFCKENNKEKTLGPRLGKHGYFDEKQKDGNILRRYENGRAQLVDKSGNVLNDVRGPILSEDESDFDIRISDGSQLRVYDNNATQYFNDKQMPLTPRLSPTTYYDVKKGNNITLRRYGDGTILEITKDPSGKEIVTTKHDQILGNQLIHRHQENPNKTEDFTWIKADSFRPKYYFFSRTPYQSISDSEQIDFIVSDFLTIFEEDRSIPYIFLQWKVKEKRTVPYDPAIKDSSHDKILMISPATSWFLLRATQAGTRRTLYFPYNLRKDRLSSVTLYAYRKPNAPLWEDESSPTYNKNHEPSRVNENVSMPKWALIDETQGAALVTPPQPGPNRPYFDPNCPYERALRLQIDYTQIENRDGTKIKKRTHDPLYLRYPTYLGDPSQYQDQKMEINLYREKIGPAPLVKFTLVRQNAAGAIVMRNGVPPFLPGGGIIDRDTWETFVAYEPFSEEEYRKASAEVQAKAPYVDRNDEVHLPAGRSIGGRSTLTFLEYKSLRKWLMQETLYERFLPLETHMHWIDPAYIE